MIWLLHITERSFYKEYKKYLRQVMTRLEMKNYNLQYDSNREAPKISVLSSGKSDNYEYLTGEKTLLFNQRQII